MRRAILAVTATVAGLVALLSFKTHAASQQPVASAQPTTAVPPGGRAVTGNVANTAYGPVQVQVVIKATKIVKVNILEQPTATAHDLQIGQFAFPKLIAETLQDRQRLRRDLHQRRVRKVAAERFGQRCVAGSSRHGCGTPST
jgi:uncharacterized protein with FMN-binding domain